MDAKEHQPPGLGAATTTAETSERKPSGNASRGRRGGGRGGASSSTQRPQRPIAPSGAAGSAVGGEGAPRSSRRRLARPPPPPQHQPPLPPPTSVKGNGDVVDHTPPDKRPQRPPPPLPRAAPGNMGVGGRPPRPITPKHRPASSPISGGAPLNSAPGGSNPVAGGGGRPMPHQPRPPRPGRPTHTATAGSAPGTPEGAAAAPASSASTGQARSARPPKEALLPPHAAQPRHRPRPDLPAAAANVRARPRHKPAGKPAAAAPIDAATASTLTPTASTTAATESSPAPMIASKSPSQKTPQRPKQGPKESPKGKGVAPPPARTERLLGRPVMPTRKQGNAIATGESSKSVSQASVLPPLKHADPKPTTKVSIRWLPVDLPEHVFWRSVEPALPWFDPQSVGSLVQKEREVLRGLCALPETVSAENGAASAEASATLEQDAAPRDEGAESVGDAQVPLATGDVLPSSKGTTTMAMVDVYESRNLDRLDSKPYWRAFVPGKQHQSKAKPADPSRAYILFATPEEVDHFYKRYHGHVFSKNGAVSRAVVELAAFQHVPWSVGASAGDILSGTIDDDPGFIAFLAMDHNSIDDGVKDEATTTAEGARPLSHVSYAAAASSSANARSEEDARGSAAAETTTPLINYLRELKGMSAGKRSAARPPVYSAQAKQAAQSSAAKSSASTPNRSGDVTPKKPRRRNR